MKRLCVFCGSKRGRLAEYTTAAETLGRLLARRGIGLVYGGGNIGLMGVIADAAVAAGGEVIGVIPRSLMDKELGHGSITELIVVDSMHARKTQMADLADGFIAMPGGYGTYEEFNEIVTWRQLGFHSKPCGLLNIAGFYDSLIAQFDLGVSEGFIHPHHRAMVLTDTDPIRLVDRLLEQCARAELP